MSLSRARSLAASLFVSLTVVACSGGGSQTTPAQREKPAAGDPAAAQTRTVDVPLSAAGASVALPLGDGYGGTIAVRAKGVAAGSTLTLETSTTTPGGLTPQSRPACPNIPPIRLINPFPFAIVLDIDAFAIDVPCNIDGALFSVGVYQLAPRPPVITVTKLGDAKGVGDELRFTPTAGVLTLPPRSTEVLLVGRESTTSGVPIPVVPGVTTLLTAGNTNVPTNLSFKFASAQGGSFFTSSCDTAYHGQTLDPQLAGVPLAGTPSFFCHLDPGTNAITFGAPVTFSIGNPKPDASVLGLDGPSNTYVCQDVPSTTSCATPAFTISNTSATAYRNVVVGNAEDLRACVPVTDDTDCNALTDPAPSRTTVPYGQEFQVLVADDPTYRPNAGPWDGLFRSSLSGPCVFAGSVTLASAVFSPSPAPSSAPPSASPGPSSSPGFPGYSDVGQQGIGAKAEFDVIPTGSGVCTIAMSEDPRFITADFSNPAHPLGRTVKLTIAIQQIPS